MLVSAARYTFAFLVGFLALGLEVQAQETSPSWKVDKASGEVWVVTNGAQNVALTSETGLKDGDSIRTGRNGRVMLRRGQETILISPNSVIGLPAEKKPGSTTIIQQAGSILLEVNKRDARTFEVETPYLVAAVKGTQFRVDVGAKGAGVNVQHGSVEVADVKSGKFALVLPGQSANVSAIGNGGLSLQGIGTLSPIQNGPPRPSSVGRVPVPRGGLVAPAAIRASLQGPASAAAVRGAAGGGLRIAAPIGQVKLDVNSATRGLAREAGTSAPGRSTATIWNNGNAAGMVASTAAAAPGSALGASVSPAINNSRVFAEPAAVSSQSNGNVSGGGAGNSNVGSNIVNSNANAVNGSNGYAYGNNGGNGKGNNGNGNGNGGNNGRGVTVVISVGNGNGGNGIALGLNSGNGNAFGLNGGNGKGNNGNGNGNGGGNGSNAGGNGNGNALIVPGRGR